MRIHESTKGIGLLDNYDNYKAHENYSDSYYNCMGFCHATRSQSYGDGCHQRSFAKTYYKYKLM